MEPMEQSAPHTEHNRDPKPVDLVSLPFPLPVFGYGLTWLESVASVKPLEEAKNTPGVFYMRMPVCLFILRDAL
jgi:hypothetical protein